MLLQSIKNVWTNSMLHVQFIELHLYESIAVWWRISFGNFFWSRLRCGHLSKTSRMFTTLCQQIGDLHAFDEKHNVLNLLHQMDQMAVINSVTSGVPSKFELAFCPFLAKNNKPNKTSKWTLRYTRSWYMNTKNRKLEIYEKWENIIFFVDVIILSESSGRTLDTSRNNKGKCQALDNM